MEPLKTEKIKEIVKEIFGEDFVIYNYTETRSKATNEFVWTDIFFINENNTTKKFNLYYLGEPFGYSTNDYSEPEWSLLDKVDELEIKLNELCGKE